MDQPDYQQQTQANEDAFKEVARAVRPDVWSIMDYLDTTGVNYIVVLKVIQHLEKIANGTRYGTVSIDIQDGIATFVRSMQNDRLNEPAMHQ